MSKKRHAASFALACDGTVLINMGAFDGPRDPQ